MAYRRYLPNNSMYILPALNFITCDGIVEASLLHEAQLCQAASSACCHHSQTIPTAFGEPAIRRSWRRSLETAFTLNNAIRNWGNVLTMSNVTTIGEWSDSNDGGSTETYARNWIDFVMALPSWWPQACVLSTVDTITQVKASKQWPLIHSIVVLRIVAV